MAAAIEFSFGSNLIGISAFLASNVVRGELRHTVLAPDPPPTETRQYPENTSEPATFLDSLCLFEQGRCDDGSTCFRVISRLKAILDSKPGTGRTGKESSECESKPLGVRSQAAKTELSDVDDGQRGCLSFAGGARPFSNSNGHGLVAGRKESQARCWRRHP